MKRLFFIYLIFSCSKSIAQENINYKYNKPGFAIQIGTGLLYGGLGTQVEYQLKFKEKIRLTPQLGIGVSIGGPPDQTDTIHSEGIWINSALGANIEYGRKHRVIIGPQLITAYYTSDILPQSSQQRIFLGYSLIAGYKGTASFGLIWQAYVGMAHMEDPLMSEREYLAPNIGLGLGYKF